MSKFKVGDKVIRTGEDWCSVIKGKTYVVSELNSKDAIYDSIYLEGLATYYMVNGFELYVEEDMEGLLTPLQAAEAILNEDKLQVYDSDCDKWHTFYYFHRNITIEDLKHIKLRLKPKTMVINGVEVPVPLHKKPKEGVLYFPNISARNVTMTNAGNSFVELFWATKEDAQKVLDAMLIPFNEL